MKFVVTIIKSVFIPIFLVAFLLCGLAAATLSAIIEFSVFKDMFSAASSGTIPAFVLAALLVGVFEISKLFLHFLESCLSNDKIALNKKMPQMRVKAIKYTKVALVCVSFVCTIIFTTSTLYLSGYNESEVTTKIDEIETVYNENIKNEENRLNNEKDKEISFYKDAEISAKEIYESYNVPLDMGENAYNRGIQQQKEYENNYNKAKIEKENKQNELENKYQGIINSRKSDIEEEKNKKIDELKNFSNSETAQKYDNPVLSKFLLFCSNTFFNSDYSRAAYMGIVLLLSLVVAGVLEILINISSSFISEESDFLINLLSGNFKISEDLEKRCDYLIGVTLNAFFSITLFLFINAFLQQQLSLRPEQMLYAVTACIVSISGADIFNRQQADKEKRYEQLTNFNIFYEIRTSVIQGSLSFIGYILIGMVFGNQTPTVDYVSIALGLGSSLSHALGFVPLYVLKYEGENSDS